MGCKKWWTSVLLMGYSGISSSTLLRVSTSLLVALIPLIHFWWLSFLWFHSFANGSTVQWVDKIKYLYAATLIKTVLYTTAWVFKSSMVTWITFCQCLVVTEIKSSTVHLVNSYCIPSLLYGCEIWSFNSSDYRKLNVIWNNAFRKNFRCCWRESVSYLFYYCKKLPLFLYYWPKKNSFYQENAELQQHCSKVNFHYVHLYWPDHVKVLCS